MPGREEVPEGAVEAEEWPDQEVFLTRLFEAANCDAHEVKGALRLRLEQRLGLKRVPSEVQGKKARGLVGAMNCTCKSTVDGHPGRGPHHAPGCALHAVEYDVPPAELTAIRDQSLAKGADQERQRIQEALEAEVAEFNRFATMATAPAHEAIWITAGERIQALLDTQEADHG